MTSLRVIICITGGADYVPVVESFQVTSDGRFRQNISILFDGEFEASETFIVAISYSFPMSIVNKTIEVTVIIGKRIYGIQE